MGLFAVIFSALLLSGFCRGGSALSTSQSGTCWLLTNLYHTFDGHYYDFMGNCTYVVAKNCNVSATLPAFEVDIKNVNEDNTRVQSVGTVTINVYGFNIAIVRSEQSIVQVNYQEWTLPINLNNGQVKIFQKGFLVIIETDFGLTVQYDWNEYLAITLPDSFAGSVCGLCGNFNDKSEDDLTTPSGSVASSGAALGQSWRVPGIADDAYCQDQCVSGECESCPLGVEEKIEDEIFCNALLKNYAQLVGCEPDVDSDLFQSSCMQILCRGETVAKYLCSNLQGVDYICQLSGANVSSAWRIPTECPVPKCPENSHYELCGSGCPATCANTSTVCEDVCVEMCACDDGFLRSGTQCVPRAQCGCMYQGHYVEAGGSFYGGQSCNTRYHCSAGGSLTSEVTACPAGQLCQVQDGLLGCYSVNYATCSVSGDPHFVTFDGELYNFQGTCAYEMAGVSNQTSQERFSVVLQNNGQDKKSGSVVNQVEVSVYGNTIVIGKDNPGAVVINGELSDLPTTLNNTLHLYTNGWFAVIETDFGVKLYYNWNGIVFLIVPDTYMGAMQGLCGNYNLNPKDDMQMSNGREATTPQEFGESWKVGTTPGCVDGCTGPCLSCNATQEATYNSSSYCGLIASPAGPFRDCHSKIDPAGYLNDCLYDVCLYQGRANMQCKTLTAYTAACQLKGITVYPWRSAQFCDAQCPSNSQYDICATNCFRSCVTDSLLSNCGAPCMEGCVCDQGYLMSVDECVPDNQCGCIYEDKYYQNGQVFYPDTLCQQECICNGTVQCKQSSCGPYETCAMKNYVRSCQPLGKAICSISGDPHYNTFDNATYDFQGTCTYLASEGCNLSGTRLTPFSVVVENEPWYRMSSNPQVSVAKLVAVEVYGNTVILRRNEIGLVWVNEVLYHLPLSLNNGAVQVYQEGTNDVIMTDFGLKVTYDLVYHITVTVPGNYRDKTCGLCGNFNNDTTDDFQLPDGSITKDLLTFGAAWKVSVPGVVCQDGCSGDLCPKCNTSQQAALEAKCAYITDPSGPFAACHADIDPNSYFRDCVYDICMAEDDQEMLCHSIAAYGIDCLEVGAKVQTWRNSSFCSLTCSDNSHYESCMLPFDSACPGLTDIITCTINCVEGCACDSNYYYNGIGCVPLDQCSCYYNGKTFHVGDSIITDDCHKSVTCHASGVVVSQNMTCNPDESCLVKNGVMGCFLQ